MRGWGKNINILVEGQNGGRLGEIRDAGKHESKERTPGVNNMDTATNSQSQEWINPERSGLREH